MASPRRIAEDGERSLIWLDDRMRPGRMPPRVEPEAVEWVEFAVSEDDAGRARDGCSQGWASA